MYLLSVKKAQAELLILRRQRRETTGEVELEVLSKMADKARDSRLFLPSQKDELTDLINQAQEEKKIALTLAC